MPVRPGTALPVTMETIVDKDRSIEDVLERLRSDLGSTAFEVVDQWDDLCADRGSSTLGPPVPRLHLHVSTREGDVRV